MSERPVGISVSWIRHHRRSVEMAEAFGLTPHFVWADGGKALRYLRQFTATLRLLRRERPDVVMVMSPPPLPVLAALPYVLRRRAMLIGDLHSGTFFKPQWRRLAPLLLRLLRRHGGAVVPNDDLAALCREAGVTTVLFHALITPVERTPAGEPYLLVPLTYAPDEPIEALLEATRRTPEITWVLTGRAPESVRSAAPENVRFSGFVSVQEYRALHVGAAGIAALTTQPSTMQSAGYEALASATPLVTASFEVLRDYFGDSAVYVDNSADELAAAARQVLAEQERWSGRMRARREEVVAGQAVAVAGVRDWIAPARARR